MGNKNKSSNQNKGKIFYFYYDMSCQNLVVYPGTPSDEIKYTIRDLLNIPSKSKVEYLDENGNPMVISSALPDKIKIYVKIKKTFTEQFIEEQSKNKSQTKPESISWTWLESERPEHHFRKNNDKTIYQPYNECIAKTKGTLIIESGEIYFTLLFEPLQCCVYAGIYPIDEDKAEKGNKFLAELDFWRLWPDYCDPYNNFPGPVIDAGFYVNMNTKLLILFDNKKNKVIHRKKFPSDWTKVCPIVNFKHVVSITISSDAIRGKPDFITI
jgi:hypothetical protein